MATDSRGAAECGSDCGHRPTRGFVSVTIAMAKAYVEARQQHGESELLDEIVAAKPERDHTHYHSPEELKRHALQHLRDSGRSTREQGYARRGRRISPIHRHAVPKSRGRSPGARSRSERSGGGCDQGHHGGPGDYRRQGRIPFVECVRTSHPLLAFEEAHDVLPNLSKTGFERLRTDLHEHVTHVLHQDQLRLVTRSFEVP